MICFTLVRYCHEDILVLSQVFANLLEYDTYMFKLGFVECFIFFDCSIIAVLSPLFPDSVHVPRELAGLQGPDCSPVQWCSPQSRQQSPCLHLRADEPYSCLPQQLPSGQGMCKWLNGDCSSYARLGGALIFHSSSCLNVNNECGKELSQLADY